MKKAIYLTFISFLIALQVMSQALVSYDFIKKTLTVDGVPMKDNKLKLNYNTSYRFAITSIDTRLYRDFTINSEQRDFFENESHADFDGLYTPAKLDTGTLIPQQIDLATTQINDELEALMNEFLEIAKRSNSSSVSNVISAVNIIDKERREREIENMIYFLPPEEKKELGDNWAKQQMLENYENSFLILKELANSVTIFFNNIERLKDLNNILLDLNKQYKLTREDLVKQVDSLESKYADVLEKKNILIIEFDRAILNFMESYQSFKNDEQIKEAQKIFPEQEILVRDLVSSIETKKKYEDNFNKDGGYSEMIENIQLLLFRLKNETITDLYFNDQIIPKKDQVIINIEFKELDLTAKAEMITTAKRFDRTFDVKGGAKISFSTGLMLTMLLFDREYSVYDAADSGYSVIRQDSNWSLFQPTIGAMMHVLYRSPGSVTGGFTWGVGTNITEISDLTIFMGGCAVFGRDERFILSAGFATAPVKYLNGKYSTDVPIKDSDLDLTKLTKDVFRPGFFIGFTYNLTGQKTEKP